MGCTRDAYGAVEALHDAVDSDCMEADIHPGVPLSKVSCQAPPPVGIQQEEIWILLTGAALQRRHAYYHHVTYKDALVGNTMLRDEGNVM